MAPTIRSIGDLIREHCSERGGTYISREDADEAAQFVDGIVRDGAILAVCRWLCGVDAEQGQGAR